MVISIAYLITCACRAPARTRIGGAGSGAVGDVARVLRGRGAVVVVVVVVGLALLDALPCLGEAEAVGIPEAHMVISIAYLITCACRAPARTRIGGAGSGAVGDVARVLRGRGAAVVVVVVGGLALLDALPCLGEAEAVGIPEAHMVISIA